MSSRLKLRLRSELSRCDPIGAIVGGGVLLFYEATALLFVGFARVDGLILPPGCALGWLWTLCKALTALLLGLACGTCVGIRERALVPVKLRGGVCLILLTIGELTKLKLIACGAFLSGAIAGMMMLAAAIYLLCLLGRIYMVAGCAVVIYSLALCAEIYFCIGVILLN